MQKKSIIAVLSAVVLMVVASLALVFTIGPKTSADSEVIETVPVECLSINDGVLGDGSTGGAFTADGKTWIQNNAKYRVEIPAGVTSIGRYAFSGCSGLTSITIPEGVTSIGNCAFSDCSGLTSITIPEGVISIGRYAFYCCSGLINITIPEGVTSISDSAFSGCSGLTSITIPEGVTFIGQSAFRECSGLTGSITIPESVTRIDLYAFSDCSGLTSITFAENSQLTSIRDFAFYNCSGLTSITIPEGVTSIDDYAFECCSGLTSITIPNSVTSIGREAFWNCSGLNEIIVRNPDLMTDTNLQSYASKLHYGAEQNTVSFVTNCDTSIDDRLVDFGVVTTEPTSLTKKHYTFAGWYSDEQYSKPFTFDTPIKYDITLYAKWEENPTVTFTVDGTEYSSETIEYNTAVLVPTEPTKTGYTFMGWYRNNAAYDFNTLVIENITLTAKWQINQYTVEFWWQNGIHTGSQTVEHGTPVQRPTDPTKEGYTFVGWFTDDLYQHPYDFNTPVTEDFGLFAQWTINQYTVTFDSKQGSSVLPQTVNWNTKISRPSDPVREGYDFLGWYLNNEEYNFDEFVTDNITLTAKWKSNNPDFSDDPADSTEENPAVNNQNNNGLLWGILGTSGGILLVGGIVFGIVISKRRRK